MVPEVGRSGAAEDCTRRETSPIIGVWKRAELSATGGVRTAVQRRIALAGSRFTARLLVGVKLRDF